MDAEDRVRALSNRDRVLAALKIGPCTNHRLREIGGSRALGRVHELREMGHHITVTKQGGSTWLVTLNEPLPIKQPSLFQQEEGHP